MGFLRTQWKKVTKALLYQGGTNAEWEGTRRPQPWKGEGINVTMGKRWVRGHLIALNVFKPLSPSQWQLQTGHVRYVDLTHLLYPEGPQKIVGETVMDVSTFKEGNNMETTYCTETSQDKFKCQLRSKRCHLGYGWKNGEEQRTHSTVLWQRSHAFLRATFDQILS